MYENFDEMNALAKAAQERLEEQVTSNNEECEDDLYADFRQYEDEDNVNEDKTEDATENLETKEVYYGPLPELSNSGESEPIPTLDAYDQPLFPGGPGKVQIQAWKKEWEGYDLYVTEVLNESFVFRTLNRFEYKQLISLQNVDALQREEVICETVTLWPENYTWKAMATTKAGIPSTYSDIIMEKSGFTKDYAIQII